MNKKIRVDTYKEENKRKTPTALKKFVCTKKKVFSSTWTQVTLFRLFIYFYFKLTSLFKSYRIISLQITNKKISKSFSSILPKSFNEIVHSIVITTSCGIMGINLKKKSIPMFRCEVSKGGGAPQSYHILFSHVSIKNGSSVDSL